MIIAIKRFKPLVIPFYFILLTVLTSSCATVFNGSKQKVMFTSNPAGAEVFVNGKTTGKFTPCTVKVRRKVKAGPNNRQNEQHYVLKKEGYHDYEVKDWRGISSGATIGNSIATLLGASFIAVGVGDTALTSTGFMMGLPMVASFPIDLMTGAIYTYDKQINANMVKKEREIVYLKTDSTVFKPTEPSEKLAKVYAVIVGVSDYHDKKMNLKYADDDARLFYNFLKSPNGGAVPDQNITLLLNTDATRANIIKAVNNQFKNAFEEDVVIVYMASHGVPSSHGDELYFLGADTDRENLEGTGVSQYDIQKALNNCRSQKKNMDIRCLSFGKCGCKWYHYAGRRRKGCV